MIERQELIDFVEESVVSLVSGTPSVEAAYGDTVWISFEIDGDNISVGKWSGRRLSDPVEYGILVVPMADPDLFAKLADGLILLAKEWQDEKETI